MSRLYSLDRALGPDNARALFKVNLDDANDGDVLKLSAKPHLRAMGERLERATAMARKKGWLPWQERFEHQTGPRRWAFP